MEDYNEAVGEFDDLYLGVAAQSMGLSTRPPFPLRPAGSGVLPHPRSTMRMASGIELHRRVRHQ